VLKLPRCRDAWYVVWLVAGVLGPRSAEALALSWASGGKDLAVTEATRCTLVVQAKVGEVTCSPTRIQPQSASHRVECEAPVS
jgi:hypothetical protein